MSELRWVVFDYGEVISRPTAALPELARLLDVSVTAFQEAYWADRDIYDRDSDEHEYWTAVSNRLGITVDQTRAAKLAEIDLHGWLHPDPESLALLAELTETGVPLALLSNAPSAFGRLVEQQPWSKQFEHLLFSGDFGVVKPDPRIWQILVDRLGARPAECLFLDDRQSNIDGARAAGLHAERWSNADTIRDRLVALDVLSGIDRT